MRACEVGSVFIHRKLKQRLAKMDMALLMSGAALQSVAEASFDTVYDARPLKRAIRQEIENLLAFLYNTKAKVSSTITVCFGV